MHTFYRVGVLLCALGSGGCVALAVGGGAAGLAGFAYVKGSQERTYSHPIDVVWAAALSGLNELELQHGTQRKDQLQALIQRHTAAGDRIDLRLTNDGTSTTVKLRVNTFGKKPLSLAIFEAIERYLPHESPEGPDLFVPQVQSGDESYEQADAGEQPENATDVFDSASHGLSLEHTQ